MLPSPAPLAAGSASPEIATAIRSVADIVLARQCGRTRTTALGFDGTDVTLITAAISEVARNILDHARQGEITFTAVAADRRRGIRIVARDQGPGIADVPRALSYRNSSQAGLGMGLPGARWLMDEFEITSVVGLGTTVTMIKWLPETTSTSPGA